MYAIMVCLDGKDDWIYVTENTNKCDMWNLKVQTYEDVEEAMEVAKTFQLPGKPENVMVVSYHED
jgi:hypothetical protein